MDALKYEVEDEGSATKPRLKVIDSPAVYVKTAEPDIPVVAELCVVISCSAVRNK